MNNFSKSFFPFVSFHLVYWFSKTFLLNMVCQVHYVSQNCVKTNFYFLLYSPSLCCLISPTCVPSPTHLPSECNYMSLSVCTVHTSLRAFSETVLGLNGFSILFSYVAFKSQDKFCLISCLCFSETQMIMLYSMFS